MISYLKLVKRYGITSPYGPVLFPCALFLAAWLFPPGLYTHYVYEPDRMFLDLLTALYFFLCVGAFIAGLKFQRMARPKAWRVELSEVRPISPLLYLCVPLFIAILFCGAELMAVGAKLNFLAILVARQGENIKQMQLEGVSFSSGILVSAPIVLTGVLWWFFLRVRQLRLDPGMRGLLILFWLVGLLLEMTTNIATVVREDLMSLVFGCALIYFFWRESQGKLRFGRLPIYATVSFSLLGSLFLLLSFLRGNAASNLLIGNLLGYSVVSYNRLASLLHGQMSYLYGGRGLYLFYYLQHAYALDKIFHFQGTLHWPDFTVLQRSEFSSTALAGLNNSYIWSGTFGYLYADLGWGALVYVFFAGVFAGYVWSKFKAGAAWAVVCWPWIAIWIIFWNGTNALFDGKFVHLAMTGALLTAWDGLMLMKVPRREKAHGAELNAAMRPTPLVPGPRII